MRSITTRRLVIGLAALFVCAVNVGSVRDAASATFVQAYQVLFKASGTATVARSGADKLGDILSVKDFGAKGDGTTDDRAALASASAAPTETWLPAGTYRVASNVTLTGTWRFAVGAALKPSSAVNVTFDGAAMIYAGGPVIDTSAGGSVNYQAGASISMVQAGTLSKTDNFIRGFAGNAIAPDVSISVINGGGNVGTENLIGYLESLDRVTGNGATASWTTSYDAAPANILVNLIRADKVRVQLTSGQFSATQSGTKVLVQYPLPGHNVNDGTGGAEGANTALLATEQLYISSNVKTLVVGSGSDYSDILGGYDNVISTGIRQLIEGAHHRITSPDHNSIVGGSYGRISAGNYGFIGGGTANEIGCTGSGSTISGFGNLCTGTGPGVLFGSTNTTNGANATAIGANNSATANGATALGRTNTVSGGDSFAAGQLQTVTAPFSGALGFTNSLTSATGYSLAAGRQNSSSGAYGSIFGFLNTATADYTTVAGKQANAALPFAHVLGGEQIAAVGDNQTSTLVAHRQTTTATATDIRLGAATSRLTIPSNTTWSFSVLVSARQVGATAASAGWKLEGVLRNDAATVALVGTVTKTVLGKDTNATSWDVTAVADTTNKALSISATGAAATINWVARVELAEISG